MLASAAFGVLVAAVSISEEIEGRTAVTLMSKPVSRRQFLLGGNGRLNGGVPEFKGVIEVRLADFLG